MKLIPVTYFGFTAMDRRFSSPMLPWIVSEIRKREYNEKLSLGIEEGILQAYNPDFELQFSHKIWQVTRFSQADQDPTTFLYLMRDDSDTLLYCYLFQAKKSVDVLHVVDRVLDPMLHTPYENPSAYDFLENYQNWKLGGRKVSEFLKRVQFHHKEDLFKKKGGHTFFVPIDDKAHDHRLQAVDGYVIEGHVIPNVVLFTRPTPQIYHETMVNYDYIYIVASMLQNHGKDSVKSVTVVGDSGHKKGEIVAEIVVGNIPVTNGVVHLISQPLAVFDRELKPFPYLSVAYKVAADPELNITHLLAKKGRVGKILRTEKGMYTVFAPKNHAWNDYLGYNSEDLSDILARHVVVSDTRLTMSKLATAVLPTETLGGSVNLRAVSINGTFFLSWGDKKVRVIRPDYECSDGVVHVIDDILADPKPRVAISTDYSLWKFLKDLVGT